MFSDFALRFIQMPLNRGPLEGATHYGESDPPGEGPYVQIWLEVEEGRILRAAFKSPGCPSSRACGGVLCTLITGRATENVWSLTVDDLLVIIGELPEGKGHYAERSLKATQIALAQPVEGRQDRVGKRPEPEQTPEQRGHTTTGMYDENGNAVAVGPSLQALGSTASELHI